MIEFLLKERAEIHPQFVKWRAVLFGKELRQRQRVFNTVLMLAV